MFLFKTLPVSFPDASRKSGSQFGFQCKHFWDLMGPETCRNINTKLCFASRFASRNLPGTFPALPGLRCFALSILPCFCLPVSLPGTFPALPGLRCFSQICVSLFLPSRFPSRNLPGASRIAVFFKNACFCVSGVQKRNQTETGSPLNL